MVEPEHRAEGEVQAGWGLHLVDMHLAMGNLIEIVKAQRDTYIHERGGDETD